MSRFPGDEDEEALSALGVELIEGAGPHPFWRNTRAENAELEARGSYAQALQDAIDAIRAACERVHDVEADNGPCGDCARGPIAAVKALMGGSK